MTTWDVEDPAVWDDLFTRDIGQQSVQFVRPADTDRPTWSVYEAAVYRGTVAAEQDAYEGLQRVYALFGLDANQNPYVQNKRLSEELLQAAFSR
ncbi:hypothetical protein [Streptomyces sp. KLOTTS4A1]|uniref:hypothetical protein n=1 Tax=Streptomyces sp. KLOTTS4A1 TaxID=3390996 RepID=UPI0039F51D15